MNADQKKLLAKFRKDEEQEQWLEDMVSTNYSPPLGDMDFLTALAESYPYLYKEAEIDEKMVGLATWIVAQKMYVSLASQC